MTEKRPQDAPEEVPGWYLFLQNRSVQEHQEVTHALLGIVIVYQSVLVANFAAPLAFTGGLFGFLIALLSLLKARARDPETLSRRVLDRVGIKSWADAEAKIAEGDIVTDGGEQQ